MPKYKVEVKLTATYYETVEVEAEYDDEAHELAVEAVEDSVFAGDFEIVGSDVLECSEIKEQEEKDND